MKPVMKLLRAPFLAAATATALSLGACTASDSGDGAGGAATESTSDIQGSADEVVAVLDDLGIEHTEPVRGDVGLSGAKARFDMTINGFDAGINVFSDQDVLASWQDVSDSFGGVHVAFDDTALSLNSSDGIANSVEIAPKIAEGLDGVARGV